jgi:hypothetical protein
MPLRDPTVTAKGSNFIGVMNALETQFGEEASRKVLERLPQELASALRDNNVLVTKWYPVAWYAQLHAAVDATLDGGRNMARQIGHDATVADFNGMHRLVGALLTVHSVFAQSHRLMGLYWRGGTIERLDLTASSVQLRFQHWPGFTELMWEDIMGSLEALLELCRARYVQCARIGPTGASQDSIVIEARWTE